MMKLYILKIKITSFAQKSNNIKLIANLAQHSGIILWVIAYCLWDFIESIQIYMTLSMVFIVETATDNR